MYPPVPEPVTDERRLISRPWLLFFQSIIDAITGNGTAIAALQAAVTAIQAQIVTLLSWGAWQSYTPTMSSTGTPPTNITTTGRYVADGKTIHAQITAALAVGFTPGTGVYTLTLPVASVAVGSAVVVIGSALIFDASTAEFYTGVVRQLSTTTIAIYPDDSRVAMGPTVPITFVATDQIGACVTYEAA